MSEQTGSFKRELFGFDRQEVVNYIKDFADERSALREENTRLNGEITSLKDLLWFEQSNVEKAKAEAEEARKVSEELQNEIRLNLDKTIQELEQKIADVRLETLNATEQMKKEFDGFLGLIPGIESAFSSIEEKLSDMRVSLVEQEETESNDEVIESADPIESAI